MMSPRGFLISRQHILPTPPPPPSQQQQQQRHGQDQNRNLNPNQDQTQRQPPKHRLESSSALRKDDDRHMPYGTTPSPSSSLSTAYSIDKPATDQQSPFITHSRARDSSGAMAAKRKHKKALTTAAFSVASPGSSPGSSPTPSPPKATSTLLTRPMTPTSPVRIPSTKQARHDKRSHGDSSDSPGAKRHELHRPDAIPPSVAALLAITNIPRSRAQRSLGLGLGTAASIVPVTSAVTPRRRIGDERMTVEAIVQRAQEAEKTISLTLGRHPLEVLLSTPDDELCEGDGDGDGDGCFSDDCDFADDASFTFSTPGTALSARTISIESVPSLDSSWSLASGTVSSSPPRSPSTPGYGRRRSSCGPTRRRPEPVRSPPGSGAAEYHPLSTLDELDFRVFDVSPGDAAAEAEERLERAQKLTQGQGLSLGLGLPLQPLKSAFKSNLTASLRALRNAARSISTMNLSSIPPEDFLTRSILTIDPRVPFTDERRPPPLDEEPSAALRRYLNPTTSVPVDPHHPLPGPTRAVFAASIQMQTYKIHRSRSSPLSPSSSDMPHPSPQLGRHQQQLRQEDLARESLPSDNADTADTDAGSRASPALPGAVPGRQREMRENSDFIRIAVMEMAMRKRGKLDDQRPGRARLALPPRRNCTRIYEVGPDGVPLRWVAVAAS